MGNVRVFDYKRLKVPRETTFLGTQELLSIEPEGQIVYHSQ